MLKSLQDKNEAPTGEMILLEENQKLKTQIKQLQKGPIDDSLNKKSLLDQSLYSKEYFKKYRKEKKTAEKNS